MSVLPQGIVGQPASQVHLDLDPLHSPLDVRGAQVPLWPSATAERNAAVFGWG